jgi:hypothetical protein
MQDKDRFEAQRDRLKAALSHPVPPDNASLPTTPTVQTQSLNDVVDDIKIIQRVITAYKLAMAAAGPQSESFWEQSYFNRKRDVHEALVESDLITARCLLSDPNKTELYYGFDAFVRRLREKELGSHGLSTYLELLLLSEAIGARRLWYPEYLVGNPDYVESFPDVETLLKCIDEHIGFRVTFPNPFAGEIGLPTSRGIASFRAVQSLYQACLWRA